MDLTDRHAAIAVILKVPEDLQYIFDTIASLCDPFTQPEENEKVLLSVDLIADVVIGITYSWWVNRKNTTTEDSKEDADDNEDHDDTEDGREDLDDTERKEGNEKEDTVGDEMDINSIKFELSTLYYKLLRIINTSINASDELTTRYLNNDPQHYLGNLPKWTPPLSLSHDEINLKITYSIACVLLLCIYKLFKKDRYNLTMNPYLHYLLKMWKCHTNVILLGLEIDRRIEFDNHENNTTEETPEIVKLTLKGSSSVRYVLAWILNQNPSLLYEQVDEDIRGSSLIDFQQPMRRANGGGILIDMRLVVIGMVILSGESPQKVGESPNTKKIAEKSDIKDTPNEGQRRINQMNPITEIGDVLIDLEYDDRFDEDIRYIFDSDEDYDEPEAPEDEPLESLADEDESGSVQPKETAHTETRDTAVRSKSIEFDEFGRDWRDFPRGENTEYQPWFLEKVAEFQRLKDPSQSDFFFSAWDELHSTLEFLSTNTIEGESEAEKRVGQVVINSIAKLIMEETASETNSDTDKIYKYWSLPASDVAIETTNKSIVPVLSITNFELLFLNNNKLARCLMDEMLMCHGYRRVLIWFLTHNINLSALLIDYIFELLTGMRGKSQTSYRFTRLGGKLILSEVEQLMLLHEFLTTSGVYLSATNGMAIEGGYEVVLADSVGMKYMLVICLMIEQLIAKGVIDLAGEEIHDYKAELQALLVNWVGRLPEARKLFFRVSQGQVVASESKSLTMPHLSNSANLTELIKKYSFLTSSQIAEDLQSSDSNALIMAEFTSSMVLFINQFLGLMTKKGVPAKTVHLHFALFFEYFNTFCKIELVAETLFDAFESIVGGVKEDKVNVSDTELEPEKVEMDELKKVTSSKKKKKKGKKKR